jgi:hypothetical protein
MRKHKGRILKDQSKLASPLDQREDDLYIGQPGYRTRRGRSGLDYIETQAEFGHSMGTIIRKLLSGRLYVRNPFSLIFLGILGLMFSLPGILLLGELASNLFSGLSTLSSNNLAGRNFSLLSGGVGGAVLVGLVSLVGILLLVNVAHNLYQALIKKQTVWR